MSKPKIHSALLVLLILAGVVPTLGQTIVPSTKEQENKLIAILKSADASHKAKADACRLLAIIGTKDAVAPLAALLDDEKLSDMARYGLEPIPDPAVERALRNALGRLEGRPLVGVIGSIGVRRDVKAVPALGKLLYNPDPEVAQAAARSLGSIGTSEAGGALTAALPRSSGQNKLAIYEGLFRCAETLAAAGKQAEAITIYDRILNAKAPHQVRGGALRGAILCRNQKDRLQLLRRYLRSDDYILFSAAVQTSLELPGEQVTSVLAGALGQLPTDNQILVARTLGKRGDPAAVPALLAVAKSGKKEARIAAIRALPGICGSTGASPDLQSLQTASAALLEMLADSDPEISGAAKESLGSFPPEGWYSQALKMLKSGQASQQLAAIELIGRRRIDTAPTIARILEVVRDAEPAVRQAAIKMVGDLGQADQIPALLDLLTDLQASRDLNAIERALDTLLGKVDDPQSYTARFIGLLGKAQPAQKGVLLRLLGVISDSRALNAVRAATKDRNPQVSSAAVRVLCSWKTAEAAPDLLALATNSTDKTIRTAALRGYISVIRDQSLTTQEKLAMCRQAARLIKRTEEKKLLLGVLGEVPSAEALAMAMEHLDNPATKLEACFAAVAVGEKIAAQRPKEVAEAITKVLKATDNRDVRRRGRAVLEKARKASATR